VAEYGKPEYQPSFGRRLGRPLNARKTALLDEMLPRLELKPLPAGQHYAMEALFPGKTRFCLELGFGAGEHLAARATESPHTGFIGGEPFLNGVASLLAKCETHALDNIRIVPDDIRPVMRSLPDASLDTIYVLYPDPWPKQRHWKRRIINQDFLTEAARLLKPRGVLQMATDHRDYSVWMLEQLLHPHQTRLAWQAKTCDDWQEPPPGWVPTRYEIKTRAQGREPIYLACVKQ
jgi:tRNA (guanine-N7-)-methyltransferase